MKRRRHSVTQRIRFFDLFRSRHRNPKLSKRQRLSPSKASATRQLADHQRSAWKPSRSPHVGFCIESANLLQSELCIEALSDTQAAEEMPQFCATVEVFQFVISDAGPEGKFVLDLKNGSGAAKAGEESSADCTITMADADLMAMAEGKLDGMQAFMGGKLKIKGNMMLAQKLQSILEAAK
eukprot:symbB.v1.2.041348.t1/scaffold8087.1/size7741/2